MVINMKKFTRLAFASLLSATLLASPVSFANSMKTVRVSQIVEHPALDQVRQGIFDSLKSHGYIQGKNLDFKFATAQGNPAIAVQIAKQYAGENPDVLVGIATPSAQALAATSQTTPIVYAAVTDPIGAKLIKNTAHPESNVTGLSDRSPVKQHVALMQELVPHLKTIGIIYNPGESNSIAIVAMLKKYAGEKGIKIVEATARKSADVQSATQAIAADVDIIYAAMDNTVASAIESLIRVTNMTKTPVVAATDTFVPVGALASLGFSNYQVGIQSGDYVAKILDGEKVANLPARTATGNELILNLKAAKTIGFTFSQAMLGRATKILK